MLWKNQSIYKVVFPLGKNHHINMVIYYGDVSVCGVWCVKSKRFMSHYQLLVRSVIENWWRPVIQNWWLSGARWTQNFFAVSFIFHRTKNVTTKNEKKRKKYKLVFCSIIVFPRQTVFRMCRLVEIKCGKLKKLYFLISSIMCLTPTQLFL
jgi:hypothetical protein